MGLSSASQGEHSENVGVHLDVGLGSFVRTVIVMNVKKLFWVSNEGFRILKYWNCKTEGTA
jgi:hypothetical protein